MNQPGPSILDGVLAASRRAAADLREEMGKGLNGLATIASIAPSIGLLGTVAGIPAAFGGCGGERSVCMAVLADGLSRSIWPTAIGLFTGLVALWTFRYLRVRLDALTWETQCAAIDLRNQLGTYRGPWTIDADRQSVNGGILFGQPCTTHKQYGLAMVSGVSLTVAWFLAVARSFEHDRLPLDQARSAGCLYVLFVFVACLLPAHFVWERMLHRRHGGLMAAASVLCLVWCAVELLFRIHF